MTRKMLSLLFFLFLTACNLPGKVTASAPQAWFDMPLPETILYPPNPCNLIAHGASSIGIAAFEVYINGVFSKGEPAPASDQTLATIEITCQDLIPGKNIVEIRSQDSSGAWSEFTKTTIILLSEDNLAELPTPLTGEGTAPAQTAISSESATLTPTMRETLPNLPSATFTPTTVRATSTPTPTATFTPTTVRATSTPTPTATSTPTLIPSYTPTRLPNPTSTPTDACSIYTDERSCIANGCVWVTIPGTVPIYECRNP